MSNQALVESTGQSGNDRIDARISDGLDQALPRHDDALRTCLSDAGQILAPNVIQHLFAVQRRVKAHETVYAQFARLRQLIAHLLEGKRIRAQAEPRHAVQIRALAEPFGPGIVVEAHIHFADAGVFVALQDAK